MKAKFWAWALFFFLARTAQAQQPALPTKTNTLATNSTSILPPPPGFALDAATATNSQTTKSSNERLLARIKAMLEPTHDKAEKGDAVAQTELGDQYRFGNGVPQDYAEALKWYRKAADQGQASAQNAIGDFYQCGHGVPQDYAEAVKWYRKAADQGLAAAEAMLGESYKFGDGVPQDYAEAVKWYRKAADQGLAWAQATLGVCYKFGDGVTQDSAEAVKWYRKAADQGLAAGQAALGDCYRFGEGVPQDYTEAVKWYREAAESGDIGAQFNLGVCYRQGEGVAKDDAEAVKWYRKAAEQGDAAAQGNLATSYLNGTGIPKNALEAVRLLRPLAEIGNTFAQGKLGICYEHGEGVPKDYVEAYKWYNLAAAQGDEGAAKMRSYLEKDMAPAQIAEAQRLAREFVPRKQSGPSNRAAGQDSVEAVNLPRFTGTGFFVTDDGCLVTSYHVVEEAARISIRTQAGTFAATLVKADKANDVALLKVTGKFLALPVALSRGVKLGESVFTIGFPNIELQGFAPKLTKGEISSLTGIQDDPRYFQISAPLQPGNSGGALVDARGNVVGVVSAKLDAATALAATGALPENVNYAIKSSFLLSFLESVPDVAAKMKASGTKEEKFEDVVKSAEQAAVLVLVH